MLLFEWLENLIFNSSTSDVYCEMSKDLHASKHHNSAKFSALILLLFCPSNSNKEIENYYCSRLNKRLDGFLSSEPKQYEHFNNYFKMWIDVLMVKSWHKYKSLVKLVDYLIKYLFYYENATLNDGSNSSFSQSISLHLIDKLIYYVRQDFGLAVIANASSQSQNDSIYTENAANAEHQSLNGESNLRSNSDLTASTSSLVPVGAASGVVSNWIQPSFSWLGSSLSYVVTTTTSQIGSFLDFYFKNKKIRNN